LQSLISLDCITSTFGFDLRKDRSALAGLFRARARLEAEILVLWQQINVLRRKSPEEICFRQFRPIGVRWAVSPRSWHCRCAIHRPARDRGSLAPRWISIVLALEIETARRETKAMSGVSEGSRELLISTRIDSPSGVLVAVQDSGPGLFDAFYTTKPRGMGMGLSICRSIVEAHGGRVWASRTASTSATVQFTLPVG
jgi:signal transduction histidine kinase